MNWDTIKLRSLVVVASLANFHNNSKSHQFLGDLVPPGLTEL